MKLLSGYHEIDCREARVSSVLRAVIIVWTRHQCDLGQRDATRVKKVHALKSSKGKTKEMNELGMRVERREEAACI